MGLNNHLDRVKLNCRYSCAAFGDCNSLPRFKWQSINQPGPDCADNRCAAPISVNRQVYKTMVNAVRIGNYINPSVLLSRIGCGDNTYISNRATNSRC